MLVGLQGRVRGNPSLVVNSAHFQAGHYHKLKNNVQFIYFKPGWPSLVRRGIANPVLLVRSRVQIPTSALPTRINPTAYNRLLNTYGSFICFKVDTISLCINDCIESG